VWLPANPDDPNERYLVGYRQLDVPDAADASRVQAIYARLWPQGDPERSRRSFSKSGSTLTRSAPTLRW
jgi:hypothetical protein